ncbi:MAG: GEVED domain-containing protein, partial [Bacteroidota bacterium]
MFKNYFLTTALLGLVATSGFAQSVNNNSDDASSSQASITTIYEMNVLPASALDAADGQLFFEADGDENQTFQARAILNGQAIERQATYDGSGLLVVSGLAPGEYSNFELRSAGELLYAVPSVFVNGPFSAAVNPNHVRLGLNGPAPAGDFVIQPDTDPGVVDDDPVVMEQMMMSCPGNPVQNSGFENGINNWYTAGSGVGVTYSVVYAGNASLVLDHPNSSINQTVSVNAGDCYEFRAYGKSHSNAGQTGFVLDFLDASGAEIGEVSTDIALSSGYNEYVLEGTIPNGVHSVRIVIYRDQHTNGDTFADEICLQTGGSLCPIDGGVPPEDFAFDCDDGTFIEIYESNIECNDDPQAITMIPNSSNVFQVVAEVVYKNANPGNSIIVDASNGNSYVLTKVTVPGNSSNVRVYRGLIPTGVSSVSYTDQTSNGCTNNNNNNFGLQSLVSYAFRTTTVKRSSTGTFTGLSGYNNLQSFTIPVPTDNVSRNMTVRVPISEITIDGRYLTLNAKINGTIVATQTIRPQNGEPCCIRIVDLPLLDVAGTVDEIEVEVDTRNDILPGFPGLNGQSYVISGIVYADVICPTIGSDYNDAPASYGEICYIVSNSDAGMTQTKLGNTVDAEAGPINSNDAQGDDNDGIDDEDGVIFVGGTTFEAGTTKTITISWSSNDQEGHIFGWIDWNLNGSFDSDEVVVDNFIVGSSVNRVTGTHDFHIQVPNGIACGTSYARFTINSDVDESGPTGNFCATTSQFDDGEVEDYQVNLSGQGVVANVTSSPAACGAANGSITITFDNPNNGQTQFLFSLDGGNTFEAPVSVNAGMVTYQVGPGTYNVVGQFGNETCDTDLGTVVVEESEGPLVSAFCGSSEQSKTISNVIADCPNVTNEPHAVYADQLFPNDLDYSQVNAKHWSVVGTNSFEEFPNGTARMQLTVRNNQDNSLRMTFDVLMSGRTQSPPPGSPKLELCVDHAEPDWYYYPAFSGTVTGQNGLAGLVLSVQGMGTALQVGTGANLKDNAAFGLSSWLSYAILSQPTTGVQAGAGAQFDFNLNLNGSQLPSFDIDEDGCDPICVGESTTINAVGSGGTGDLTFTWMPGNLSGSSITVSPTTTTTYTVTVEDENGCTSTDEVTIEVNPSPIITCFINVDGDWIQSCEVEVCEGSSIQFGPQSDSFDGSWSWTGPNNFTSNQRDPILTNSATADLDGVYTVTYTNPDGCTSSKQLTINIIGGPSVTVPDVTVCEFEDATLMANVNPAGNYSYSWNTGATSQSITFVEAQNVDEGIYTVVVTDQATGCSATASGELTVRDNYDDGGEIAADQNGCIPYDANLLISLSLPSGGEVPGTEAEFQWFLSTGDCTPPTIYDQGDWVEIPGATSATLDPGTLTETTCFLRCSRVPGCDLYLGESNVVTITVNPNPEVSVNNVTICEGESGTLTATPSGGTPPYQYSWSNGGGTNQTATYGPLTATTSYSVTVEDANGCTATANGTITVLKVPDVTINGPVTVCAQDQVTFTVTSAGAGATYSWDFGEFASPATADVQNPGPVTYTLPAGQNGNVTSTITLTITKDGCTDETTTTIEIFDLPEITDVETVNPICGEDNGSITISFVDNPDRSNIEFSINGVGGPYTEVPDNSGSITFNDLDAGTYDLYVRWGNGNCPIDLEDATISDELAPTVTASDDVTICLGESTTLTAMGSGGTGNLTFSWSPGNGSGTSFEVSPTATTTYTVTVEDENGCTNSDQVTVTVLEIFTVTVPDMTVCEFEDVSFTATVEPAGNYTFSWNTGDTGPTIDLIRVQGSDEGTYTVVVTDQTTGCTVSASGELTVRENYDDGGDIAADQNGCIPYDADVLTSVSLPSGGDAPGTEAEYQWFLSTGDCTPPTIDDQGDWILIPGATDLNYDPGVLTETTCFIRCSRVPGCELYLGESNVVTITVNPNPEVSVNNVTICAGETGTLTATPSGGTPPYQYSWSNGGGSNQTATYGPLTATMSYTVTVEDANGCTATASGTITVTPLPVAEITPLPGSECEGTEYTFTAADAGAGAEYEWDFGNGATPATGTGPGPIVVTYTTPDAGTQNNTTVTLTVFKDGCENTDTENVTVRPRPDVTITAEVDPTTCEGADGSITVDVTVPSSSNFQIGIDDGNGVVWQSCNATTFGGLAAGTYDISVRYCNGDCPYDITSVTLSDPDSPIAEINGPAEVCVNNDQTNFEAVFSASTPSPDNDGATYQWNFGADATPATIMGPGPHTVTFATPGQKSVSLMVMRDGCTASDAATINVLAPPVVVIDPVEECSETNVALVAEVTGAGPFTYEWEDNGSTGNEATYMTGTYTLPTQENYSVSVTDANGCTTVATGTITVNPL